MSTDLHSDVTTLLEAVRAGDGEARQRLIERLYRELHRTAERLMRGEAVDHTLQPTALLHEALARLFQDDVLRQAPNRAYLVAAALRAMREVLVEHARSRNAAKRGGGRTAVPLDAVLHYFAEQKLDVQALHEALDTLAGLHTRQSQVVSLRFFGGFTVQGIAALLDVSVSTVESDFRLARAWLRQQLGEGGGW